MKKDKFILNILGSNSDKEEYQQIESWIEDEKLATQDLIAMTQILDDADKLKDYQSFDTNAALSKTLEKIDSNKHSKPSKSKAFLIPSLVIGVLLLSLIGIVYYLSFQKSETTKYYYANQQSVINRTDGTIISLSHNAELKEWSKKNQYELKGIASFDVSKQEKPMIISVPQGAIKVIGTEFLVNAKNNQTSIDLYEGVVELTNENGKKKTLTQGNRAIIKDNSITLTSFSEKSGKVSLVYKGKPLQSIIKELELLFNIKIVSNNPNENSPITAIYLDETLEQILNELSLISGTTLSIEK